MTRQGLCAAILLVCAHAQAAPVFGPFRTQRRPVTSDAKVEVHPAQRLPSGDPLYFAFQVYQRTLSSQDGPRCAHSPTCSLYGVQAVRRHPVLGFFLTVDRLWKANRSSELRPLPAFQRDGIRRFYDPLDASDFWLRGLPDDHAPEFLPPRLRQ